PINASMAALRLTTHDSGSGWLAMPFLYDSFIHNSTPVYPGALHNLLRPLIQFHFVRRGGFMRTTFAWLLAAGAAMFVWQLAAQQPRRAPEQASWAPKPVELPKYQPPNKPQTKIADLKKKHAGQSDWREAVVDDPLLHADYVSVGPGGKVPRRFHPDTRAWWIVTEGQMKVDIEGQDSFVAGKGTMIQVPMQTVYSMETVGDQPVVRFQVGIAHDKTLYPIDVKPPEM